jgi:hypothetical protein
MDTEHPTTTTAAPDQGFDEVADVARIAAQMLELATRTSVESPAPDQETRDAILQAVSDAADAAWYAAALIVEAAA